MVHQLDEYGNLDVEQLTLDEKKEIFRKFQDVLNHRH